MRERDSRMRDPRDRDVESETDELPTVVQALGVIFLVCVTIVAVMVSLGIGFHFIAWLAEHG